MGGSPGRPPITCLGMECARRGGAKKGAGHLPAKKGGRGHLPAKKGGGGKGLKQCIAVASWNGGADHFNLLSLHYGLSSVDKW